MRASVIALRSELPPREVEADSFENSFYLGELGFEGGNFCRHGSDLAITTSLYHHVTLHTGSIISGRGMNGCIVTANLPIASLSSWVLTLDDFILPSSSDCWSSDFL